MRNRGSDEFYLGLEHLEFTAASGPAEELAPVPGGDAGVLWDPLFDVAAEVQVAGAVVLLTLLLSEALPWVGTRWREVWHSKGHHFKV